MTSFSLILLLLLPVAAVVYVMWDYKRKTAQRNAVSAERLSELLGAAKQVQGHETNAAPAAAPGPTPVLTARPASVSGVASSPPAGTASPAPVAVSPAPPAQAPRGEAAPAAELYARRDRMLDPAQTLLYQLLKAGLPDHVIFARVTLASLLEAGPGLSGVARDEQVRRLASLTVDFVVADRSMRPLAVVDLAAVGQSAAAQSDRSSARTRLAAAGLRYVELDAKKLPRKEGMRAAVLGDERAAAERPGAAEIAR